LLKSLRRSLIHPNFAIGFSQTKNKMIMRKKSFLTMMLALVTMMGLAQTKTATVTGYSPALKDGTLVLAGTGTIGNVVKVDDSPSRYP